MEKVKSKSHIGNIFDFLSSYKNSKPLELSYLSGKWADFEQWKAIAKAKVIELLRYFPEEAPLEPETLTCIDRGDYKQEEIEFNTARNVRVKGTLLIPKGGSDTCPAIIAIHDHGGFYYYGRERIIEQDNEPEILKEYKRNGYSGRSWANEVVKRGYVVLCIDGFYFGSRRLDITEIDDEMLEPYRDQLDRTVVGSVEYIRLYSQICWEFEKLVVKHIFIAGTTWPGILFHDDRKCIDYLCSRKEVDHNRIGCCGLSIGGLRSAFLAGLDSRIKCSVVVGWMPTFDSLMFNRLKNHTYMLYIPGLSSQMDLPDVVSMTAPNPLFVQQCTQDTLYNVEGMQNASTKIEDVYKKLSIEDRFKSQFYDNGHEFNLNMQEDAYTWLDKWLKK